MIKNPNCANCSFVICKKNCPHPQNSSIKLLLRKIHDVIFTSTLANKTIEIFIYFICSCFCVQTFNKLIKHTIILQTFLLKHKKYHHLINYLSFRWRLLSILEHTIKMQYKTAFQKYGDFMLSSKLRKVWFVVGGELLVLQYSDIPNRSRTLLAFKGHYSTLVVAELTATMLGGFLAL